MTKRFMIAGTVIVYLAAWVAGFSGSTAASRCAETTRPSETRESACSYALLMASILAVTSDRNERAMLYLERGAARAEAGVISEAEDDFRVALSLLDVRSGFELSEDLPTSGSDVQELFRRMQRYTTQDPVYGIWIQTVLSETARE